MELDLIPVDPQQGRRYAERVLGRGPLLAKIVLNGLDFDAGSFAATVPFVEMKGTPDNLYDGDWGTGGVMPGEVDYIFGLVPIVHRFLAQATHSVVFDYDRLDLDREAERRVWERIETEPREPMRVFFRDVGSWREMYVALGGGDIDEATAERAVRRTGDAVREIALMLDIDINKLPLHTHPVDEEKLAELARHVKGLAVRRTSYDGYLIWQTSLT